jgi:hypothetical protein
MTESLRYFAIHRRDGRIVALLSASSYRKGDVEVGWQVVPDRGQLLSEVELSAAQVESGLAALAENFRVRRDPTNTGGSLVDWSARKKRGTTAD